MSPAETEPNRDENPKFMTIFDQVVKVRPDGRVFASQEQARDNGQNGDTRTEDSWFNRDFYNFR